MSPHDLKERLLEVAEAFLPGVLKKSRNRRELEQRVEKQHQRIEERRKVRVRATGLASEEEEVNRPSAEHYDHWMNLDSSWTRAENEGDGDEGDPGDEDS